MRRVSFRVPARDLEPVLDALLPTLPAGVHVVEGEAEAAIAFVAAEPPAAARVAALTGVAPAGWQDRAVSADGRERRLAGGVRVGRAVVRPPGSEVPPQGTVDVVVEPRSAVFGSGSHPTTRMCLDLLLGLRPQGGLADLGCGLGTLAIAAAKLGWQPVVAVDREPAAARAAGENARRNGVAVSASVVDLAEEDPPWHPTLVVNAAPAVQGRVIDRMPPAVQTAIVSSFVEAEAAEVLGRWAAAGFDERERRTQDTWVAVTLVRVREGDGQPADAAPAGTPSGAIPMAAAGAPPGGDPVKPMHELLDPSHAVGAAPGLRQLATRLAGGGLAISSARTVELDARATLAYLPSLFRFDVTPQHETLAVVLRALVPVPHVWEADAASYDGFRRPAGDPIRFQGRFELPDGHLGVSIQALALPDDDQGAAHLIAKATVRPLEDPAGPRGPRGS